MSGDAGYPAGGRTVVTVETPQRRAPRDALTGETLRPTGLIMRVADARLDNAPTRQAYADGFRADLAPYPLRLHTPEVEYGGLGGHVFARQFAHYLASGLAEGRANASYAQRVWWGNAYGRRRVLARFLRDDGSDAGELAYRVALAIASNYLSYDEVMAETKRPAKWITLQVLRAETYQQEPAVRVVRPIEPRRDRSDRSDRSA